MTKKKNNGSSGLIFLIGFFFIAVGIYFFPLGTDALIYIFEEWMGDYWLGVAMLYIITGISITVGYLIIRTNRKNKKVKTYGKKNR